MLTESLDMLPKDLEFIFFISGSLWIFIILFAITLLLRKIYSKVKDSTFIGVVSVLFISPILVVYLVTPIETTRTFISGYIGFFGIVTLLILMLHPSTYTNFDIEKDTKNSGPFNKN